MAPGLDELKIPYDYISTQKINTIPDLDAQYDVILFPPVGWSSSAATIIQGLPMAWGNPLPWQDTPLTPNLVGKNDSTPDMRPGLGWDGVAKLQNFVEKGGVLLTTTDTSQFALSIGMASGVTASSSEKMKIVGAIVGTRLVDAASPIAYGYDEKVSAYCDNGPIFSLSSVLGSRRRRLGPETTVRATGRGTKDDPDFVVGRTAAEAPKNRRPRFGRVRQSPMSRSSTTRASFPRPTARVSFCVTRIRKSCSSPGW